MGLGSSPLRHHRTPTSLPDRPIRAARATTSGIERFTQKLYKSISTHTMKQIYTCLLLLAALGLTCTSCDDDHSYVPTARDVRGAVVINQGSMGYQAGTLDWLNLEDGTYTSTALTLGGTPENVVECSGYIFVPLYEENVVAVYDKSSLRAAARIAVRTPQSVCTDGEHVFAVGADSIFRISTSNLSVEQADTVGHTAYASVCAGGSVYVAIGQGWGQYEGGNLVAKVNPQTLTREYITVGINPYNQMVADESGNVFVVCAGDYGDTPSQVYRIASDNSTKVIGNGSYIDVCQGKLYVAYRTSLYDEMWNESSQSTYTLYDAATGDKLSDNFLSTTNELPTAPTFIKVNPDGAEVYVGANSLTEAGYVSYTQSGKVYRFNNRGVLINTYEAGVSPYALYFLTQRVQE